MNYPTLLHPIFLGSVINSVVKSLLFAVKKALVNTVGENNLSKFNKAFA